MDKTLQQQAFKRYAKIATLVFVLLGALMLCTNIVVSPAGIYNVVTVEGFNSIKPKLGKYRLLWKLGHLEYRQPPLVFLGNSRTEVGINPMSETAQRIFTSSVERFNSAIPGSSMYAVRRYMQHLAATGAGSEQVVIGIDYVMFRNTNQASSRPSYAQYEPLFATLENGEPQPLHGFELFARTVLSVDAFDSSLQTLRHQSDKYASITPEGYSLNRKLDEKIMKRTSPRAFFLREEQGWITAYTNIAAADYAYDDGMQDLQRIIDIARAHNIRLSFYITPTHAGIQYLEGEVDAPQNHLAQWKKSVTEAVAASNTRYPTQPAIALWDFSIVNDVLAEPIPDEQHNKLMRWYVDPSHYRESVGDLVLQTLFTATPARTPEGEQFGYRLTPATLDEVNRLHHESIVRWQQYQPAEYAALMQRIEEQRALRKPPPAAIQPDAEF